jgi:hypothetical protein
MSRSFLKSPCGVIINKTENNCNKFSGIKAERRIPEKNISFENEWDFRKDASVRVGNLQNSH